MIKNILNRISYLLLLVGGAVLCGFAPYLYTRSRLFDYHPLAIVMMIVGFLGLIIDFVDTLMEIIKYNKEKSEGKQ